MSKSAVIKKEEHIHKCIDNCIPITSDKLNSHNITYIFVLWTDDHSMSILNIMCLPVLAITSFQYTNLYVLIFKCKICKLLVHCD